MNTLNEYLNTNKTEIEPSSSSSEEENSSEYMENREEETDNEEEINNIVEDLGFLQIDNNEWKEELCYEKGNIFNKDPLRVRKLLLHKKEIRKLFSKVQEKGYALMPLEVYFSNGRVKVKIALARGKKLYDKREAIAKRDSDREKARAFREYNGKSGRDRS